LKTARTTAKVYLEILNKMYFVLKVNKHGEGAYTCDCVPQVLETEEALNIDSSIGS
jgi:hypothetical protein